MIVEERNIKGLAVFGDFASKPWTS